MHLSAHLLLPPLYLLLFEALFASERRLWEFLPPRLRGFLVSVGAVVEESSS